VDSTIVATVLPALPDDLQIFTEWIRGMVRRS
jgi:hypothetical protein